MQLTLEKFLSDGYELQQQYEEANGRPGPLDDLSDEMRYNYIIEFLGHLQEEVHEVRKLVPRRAWRTDEVGFLESLTLRENFIEEMFDMLLFFRSILSFAGIKPEEFLKVAQEKLEYNQVRKDHRLGGLS